MFSKKIKYFKLFKRIIVIGIILFIIPFSVYIPFVQNIIIDKIETNIAEQLDSKVEIKEFGLSFWADIYLKNVKITKDTDTLLSIDKILIDIKLKPLLSNKVIVDNLEINGLNTDIFKLIPETDTTDTNVGTDTITGTEPWQIAVKNIAINNSFIVINDSAMNIFMDINVGELSVNNFALELDTFAIKAEYAFVKNSKVSYISHYNPNEEIDTSATDFILEITNADIENSSFYYNDDLMNFKTGGEKIIATDFYLSVADEITSFTNGKLNSSYFNLVFVNDTIDTLESDIDWIVQAKLVDLKNNSFTYDIAYLPENKNEFDYNHIHFSNIYTSTDDLYWSFNKISGKLNSLSLNENNKLKIESASGELYVDNQDLSLKQLKIKTDKSNISLDCNMGYYVYNWEFSDKKSIDISLNYEASDWGDIEYFAKESLTQIPNIDKIKNKKILFNTEANGSVDEITTKINIAYNDNVFLSTEGTALNITNIDSLEYNFNINKLVLSKQIVSILTDDKSSKKYIPTLSLIKGDISGTINKTNFIGSLNSSYGHQNIVLKSDITDSLPKLYAKINGNIVAKNFGNINIETAKIDCNLKGDDLSNLFLEADINLAGISIDTLKYDSLKLEAKLEDKEYIIEIISTDKFADFTFNSNGTIKDSVINSHSNFVINNYAMHENGLVSFPLDLKMTSKIDLIYDLNNSDTKLNADIINLSTTDSLGINSVEELTIEFALNNNNSKFKLLSDNNIIKANVYGSLDTLIKNYNKYIDIILLEKDNEKINSLYFPNFIFYADIKKPYEIIGKNFAEILPHYSEVVIKSNFNNSKNKSFNLNLSLPDLEYLDNKFDSTTINIEGDKDGFDYKLISSILIDSMINTKITLSGDYKHNELFTHLNLSDKTKSSNFFNIKLHSKQTDLGYNVKIINDSLILISNLWNIAENNSFDITKNDFVASNILLTRNNKEISLQTDTIKNDIKLLLKNIDLSVFNSILNNDSLLAGNANINTSVSYQNDIKNIRLTAQIDTFKYNNLEIGDINIDKAVLNERYFVFDTRLKSHKDSAKFNGIINLTNKETISIKAQVSSFDLNIFNDIFDDYLYDVSGSLNSDLNISGTIKKPNFSGFIKFNNSEFGFVDLNETFTINNEKLIFDNDIINPDLLQITDRNGNKTHFSGNIQYTNNEIIFNKFALKSDAIELMNSEYNENEPVYGLIKSKLDIRIDGPIDNLNSNAKIILDYPTEINYVFPEDISVGSNDDIVNFAKIDTLNLIDSLSKNIKTEYKNRLKMFKDLDAELIIKDGCKFNLYFDKSMDNFFNVKVKGNVKYVINNNIPKTYGSIDILEGKMTYSMPMVTMDKLTIEDGSYIQIMNNIDNPFISVNASTKIWASTGGLIDDYNKNLEITVFMYMRGKLDNLVVQFDVSPTTSDPLVSSKISQLSNKERSLNAINLLVRGEFATTQNSSGINLDSYVSSIIATGLNKVISDRIKFVDMNFDMKSFNNTNSAGTKESQSNMFFNVQKGFYNDRLRFKYSSNITTTTSTNSSQENGLTPVNQYTQRNFFIEYDINKSGRFQGVLFRKDSYEDILEGEIISTGGGLKLRKTYNSFGDIFKFGGDKK